MLTTPALEPVAYRELSAEAAREVELKQPSSTFLLRHRRMRMSHQCTTPSLPAQDFFTVSSCHTVAMPTSSASGRASPSLQGRQQRLAHSSSMIHTIL